MIFTPEQLFNCRPGLAEPDWSAFTALEIAGCLANEDEYGTNVTADAPIGAADFYGIYGIHETGEAEAVTDVGCWDAAQDILGHLAKSSGLPVSFSIHLQEPK